MNTESKDADARGENRSEVLTEEDAMTALDADLARRANPEKSRLFDKDTLLRSRTTLLSISDELESAGIFQTGPDRITIVGTNGKGSTAFYLAGLAVRKPVGLYTSPHFLSVLERIRINGKPVSAPLAWKSFTELHRVLGSRFDDLSYFEAMTLAARHLFDSDAGSGHCSLQIFEAGLGGRFDAVHIARSPTIVLCPVELDHIKILGDTVEAILREKLAVISARTRRLIVMRQSHWDENFVREEAERAAEQAGARELEIVFFDHRREETTPGPHRSYLDANKDFAAFTLDRVGFPRQSECGPPPGRLEWHGPGRTRFFYDAGHNPAAVEMILDALLSDPRFPGVDRTIFFFGCLKDRDPAEIEARIRQRGFRNIFQITGPALAPEAHPGFSRAPAEGILTARTFRDEMHAAHPEEPILIAVAGSHYIYDFFIEVQSRLQEG